MGPSYQTFQQLKRFVKRLLLWNTIDTVPKHFYCFWAYVLRYLTIGESKCSTAAFQLSCWQIILDPTKVLKQMIGFLRVSTPLARKGRLVALCLAPSKIVGCPQIATRGYLDTLIVFLSDLRSSYTSPTFMFAKWGCNAQWRSLLTEVLRLNMPMSQPPTMIHHLNISLPICWNLKCQISFITMEQPIRFFHRMECNVLVMLQKKVARQKG